MTTLHILSNPGNPVHINNRVDPFSIAALKFINYMSSYGWTCVHYGVRGSEVSCENIICNDHIDAENSVNIARYNKNAGEQIALRKRPNDIIVCIYGAENKGACDANPELKVIEPSIGYSVNAIFAPYRVFVSYAQMHMFYGSRDLILSPSWFDAVIPNAITPSEFEYTEDKDDYLLYFGRVIESKGLHVAIQAALATKKKLVIAGPGSLQDIGYSSTPSHVEVVGVCNAAQRKKLMSKAKAIIGPTYYIEPFGNMVAEGYMSGTPAITTDWGGFAETVQQGVTGFRCRDMKDFINAIENIDTIKPRDCLNWAMSNYEDSVVHKQLDDYFKKIITNDFYRK